MKNPSKSRGPTRAGRFERNLDHLRAAGYNLKVGRAIVFVNGHPVRRGLFEELPTVRLQALVEDKIGAPRKGVANV